MRWRPLHAESIELFRALKDLWGLGFALYLDGMAAYWQGDYAAVRAAYEDSIIAFQTVGDKWRAAGPLGRLGDLAMRQGNIAEARRLYADSLALFREAKDQSGLATVLTPLGTLALKEGDLDQAAAYYQESLSLNQELGDKQGIAWAYVSLSTVAHRQHDFSRAESLLQRSLALLSDVGDDCGIAWVLQQKGYFDCARGNHRGAAILFEMALDMARRLNHVVTMAFCIPGFVCIAAHDDQPELAAQLLGIAEARREQVASIGSASDLEAYDRLLAEAGNTVDTRACTANISIGRTLPQTDAIDFVLVPSPNIISQCTSS